VNALAVFRTPRVAQVQIYTPRTVVLRCLQGIEPLDEVQMDSREPMTIPEITIRTGLHPRAARRVLQAEPGVFAASRRGRLAAYAVPRREAAPPKDEG
jgi:hypothetical protein